MNPSHLAQGSDGLPWKALWTAGRRLLLPAFVSFTLLFSGCGLRIPRAQKPQLISTGLQVTSSTGTATIGQLTDYCNDFTANDGPYGRGMYTKIKIPPLNLPDVTFAGVTGDYWGTFAGDATSRALSEGPRPITAQQQQNLQGSYVGYFVQDDSLNGNDYEVEVGILLGKGVPQRGTLSLRSANSDSHNTGTDARSDPLDIAIATPVAVDASLSPSSGSEGSQVTVSWNSPNADTVQISGPGFSGGALQLQGSQTVNLPCTGDLDATQALFQVRAARTGCPTQQPATQNLAATVNSTRRITRFEGTLDPFENSPFQLFWNAPGASGITITGPDNLNFTSQQSQGQTTVTAPSVPRGACQAGRNFQYHLTAQWPGSCGPRSHPALVTVFTHASTFHFEESGGQECDPNNRCDAQGRDEDEARMCLQCALGSGCHWELVN